jgi:sorbitol-specific phosphotransferase system component IIC
MVAMNTLIAFLGEERVTKVAKLSAKNPVTRYLVLPFLINMRKNSITGMTKLRLCSIIARFIVFW